MGEWHWRDADLTAEGGREGGRESESLGAAHNAARKPSTQPVGIWGFES